MILLITFLILPPFKKLGFGETFIKWIQILSRNRESRIINGGTTTQYFKLEKGLRHGNPISAYLLILVLGKAFLSIKEKKNIKGINIFNNLLSYSAYAYNTTFSVGDGDSVIGVINNFDKFLLLSGFKPIKAKCEIAGTDALKGVSLAFCSMDCIGLTKKTIKIFGTHFHIRHVQQIEKVLKLWIMRNLTAEGRTTIFKTLVISEIIYISLVTNVLTEIINKLNIMQK